MKINAISKGLIASLAMVSAVSCSSNKARERAIPYLTGSELLQADSCRETMSGQGYCYGSGVIYWDSIIAEGKAKAAYQKGIQMVEDSAAGKKYSKPDFKMNIVENARLLDKTHGYHIIQQQKQEAAALVDGKTFNQYLENAPANSIGQAFVANDAASVLHYYGLLMRTGKEREAFNQGAAKARSEINNAK